MQVISICRSNLIILERYKLLRCVVVRYHLYMTDTVAGTVLPSQLKRLIEGLGN